MLEPGCILLRNGSMKLICDQYCHDIDWLARGFLLPLLFLVSRRSSRCCQPSWNEQVIRDTRQRHCKWKRWLQCLQNRRDLSLSSVVMIVEQFAVAANCIQIDEREQMENGSVRRGLCYC